MPCLDTFAVKEYVELNVPLIRTIEDVAEALACDPLRLRRTSLREEGVRLWTYLLACRIAWVLEGLKHGSLCGACGAYALLEDRLRAYTQHIPPPDRTWPTDVQAVLACVHANPFDADLSPSTIRDTCGLKGDGYSRQFGRYMRMRVAEYVAWHRITMAKHLLETIPVKVGDVAAVVGYRTDAAFTKAFTQAEGCTPTAYRALHAHIQNGKQNFQQNGKAGLSRIA